MSSQEQRIEELHKATLLKLEAEIDNIRTDTRKLEAEKNLIEYQHDISVEKLRLELARNAR